MMELEAMITILLTFPLEIIQLLSMLWFVNEDVYFSAHNADLRGLLRTFIIPVRHITFCFHSVSGPTMDLFN